MNMKKIKNTDERPGLTADQIRELREKERIDSVYYEQTASKKAFYTALNYVAALAAGAVILVALYYWSVLVSHLRSAVFPFLSMIDDSSGFLTEAVTGVLHLLLFAIIAFLFGFALDINYSRRGRPREVWGKQLKYLLPAAFGSCLVYAVARQLLTGNSFGVSGSVLSQCFYYFTMIAIVPAANVLLFLVLPSALIRMLLTVVAETKEKAELPLILTCTAVMTLGLLGITPRNLENFGWMIFVFTLIQSAACSLLYHRTNVIRYTILLYAGVSAFYLVLAALMSRFL